VNFTKYDREPNGKVLLIGRVKSVFSILSYCFVDTHWRSHPDVGERHYPELFKHLFPNGYSGFGVA
jgi:hypothetical protein